MNKYMIDYNQISTDYPYVLYAKRGWWRPWRFITSFKTVEEARQHHLKLVGLPIYL